MRIRVRTLSLLVLLSLTCVVSNQATVIWPHTAIGTSSVAASFSPPLNESVPIPIQQTISIGYAPAAPGPQSVAVLCVEFTNQNHSKTKNEIQDIVFSRVNQYYRDVSYGKVSLTGTVSRWYQMNKTVGAYARDSPMSIDDADNDGYPDTWRLIQEAIYAADLETDFSQYSYLVILHSGPGQETSGNSNDIWSCAYMMGIWFRTRDGVTYSKAMIVPELESQGAETVGVIAHEFAHLLGLPDLYDPYRRNDYCGRWELMGKGLWNGNPASSSPAHMLAWAKIRLGWISESQIATVPGGVIRTITINPLELNGTILAVKIPITDKAYYLLELRQRIGYDMGLPDTGLLVAYIDEAIAGPGGVRIVDANPLTATLDDATIKPGRTFADTGNTIFVSVLGVSEQNYRVTVNRVGAVPDLAAVKAEIAPYPPRSGRMLMFTFQITNQGTVMTSNVTVHVYLDTALLYMNVYTLDVGQNQFIQLSWNATMGRHVARCVIDQAGQLNDINRLNNEITREFLVGSILSVRLPWTGGSIRINGTLYNANGTTVEVPVLIGAQTIEVPPERFLQLGVRQTFLRWNDGNVSNPRVYRTTGDVTLSVEYKTQYRLSISSGKGETSGDGWYDENSGATAKATSPSLMNNGKSRLVFSYWSGNYTSNSTTIQLTMNRPYNLTANWIVEHYLTIVSSVGTFAEQGWHKEGRTVQIRVVSPVDQGNHTRRVFIDWSGDLTSGSTETTVTMNSPRTIIANWRTEFELRVLSERGTPSGQGWVSSGETVRFSIESTVNGGEGVRYVFMRWTGDYEGTSNEGSTVMNSPKTVNANWKTQYLVNFRVLGLPNGTVVSAKINQKSWNGSAPLVFSEWIDAGSNMTLDAPFTIQVGPGWYVSEGWKTPKGQSVDSPQVVNAPGNLDLAYIRKPRGLLHILETAYGSDNAAQLSFLETARERYLTRTFAGRHWCDTFDRICDSLFPDLSTAMAESPILKVSLKAVLYPILQILVLSTSVYFAIGPSSEIAFFTAGFVATTFAGVVYLSPVFAPLLAVLRRKKPSIGKDSPKYIGILLFIGTELIVLGEVTRAPITTTAASFLFLTLSACLSGITIALATHRLVKQIRTLRAGRRKRHIPKSLMGLAPSF